MNKINLSFKKNLPEIKSFLILLSIASVIVAGIIIVPKTIDITKAIEALKEENEILSQKAKYLNEQSSNISKLSLDHTELVGVLPQEVDQPDFMGRITKVSTDSAVYLASFSYSGDKKVSSERLPRTAQAESFTINAEGRYEALLTFIQNLEKFAGVLTLDNIDLSVRKDDDTSSLAAPADNLSLNFSINAFFLPLNSSTIAPKQPLNLSIGSADYKEALDIAKQMVLWESEKYVGDVGRINPFSR